MTEMPTLAEANIEVGEGDADDEATPPPTGTGLSQIYCRSSLAARIGVAINIASTAIGGGGMIGNVFAASQLGIVGFVLVTALSALLTFVTIQFLCTSSQLSAKYSCYALTRTYLAGSKGEIVTKLFILIGNWSFCVNIIQIFADYTEYVLTMWTETNHINDTFFVSREFAVILGLVFIFPFITVSNIKNLEKLSAIFLIFAVLILLVMLMNAFKAIALNEVSSSLLWTTTDYNAIFRGLPPITWCWTVQFNVLPVYMTLSPLTRATQMETVSYWTVGVIFTYYILFGIASCIIWGERINDDFITNLDYNNANYIFYFGIELSTITQFVMCVITFASLPITAFEARVNLHYILTDLYYGCIVGYLRRASRRVQLERVGDIESEATPLLTETSDSDEEAELQRNMHIETRKYHESKASRCIEGTVLIASAAICALEVQDLNWSLSIVGATYGCYIAYFVPSVVYLRAIWTRSNLSRKQLWLKYMAFVTFVYGIIVCVLGVMESFL